MTVTFLERNFFQRLLGLPATRPPKDPGCWTLADGSIRIDLKRASELAEPGGALRLENKNLPVRVLVVHGDDGRYYAFRNRCRHMGRRLDPVPGTRTVQCCSVNKTTYDYQGRVLFGPARHSLDRYSLDVDNDRLIVHLSPS